MREAYPPQSTFYPCRSFPPAHLSQHALVAPRERRGGPALLKLGPQCEPCLLPSGPPQPSLAAILSGYLGPARRTSTGWRGVSVITADRGAYPQRAVPSLLGATRAAPAFLFRL